MGEVDRKVHMLVSLSIERKFSLRVNAEKILLAIVRPVEYTIYCGVIVNLR